MSVINQGAAAASCCRGPSRRWNWGAGAPLRKLLNQDDFGAEAWRRAWGAGRRRLPCLVWSWTPLFLEARQIAWSSAAPAPSSRPEHRCVYCMSCEPSRRRTERGLRQQLPGLLLDWAQLVEDARRAGEMC